jgi:hypothetical protein
MPETFELLGNVLPNLTSDKDTESPQYVTPELVRFRRKMEGSRVLTQ